VELGRYLCEVRAGQYWRLENLKSFDEFLERRFPESRRKAYYLMSIHEHLPLQAKKDLKEVGWTKGLELAKVARAEGQRFECAPWVHKARTMPREEFAREVEKEMTGRDSEPHEIIYFKIYRSQVPIVEQALEAEEVMLGTDKSRSYCLEMICADSLAGANLDNGNPEILLSSMTPAFQVPAGRATSAVSCPTWPRKPDDPNASEASRLTVRAQLVQATLPAGHGAGQLEMPKLRSQAELAGPSPAAA
jgi:hypothetical protein